MTRFWVLIPLTKKKKQTKKTESGKIGKYRQSLEDFVPGEKKSPMTIMMICQKNIRSSLKGLPLVRPGTSRATK